MALSYAERAEVRKEKDFSLSMDELWAADESDGAKLSEQCERYFFRKAQDQRVYWEPTRQIVEALSRRVRFAELALLRQSQQLRLLQAVMIMQGLAILFLAFSNFSF